MPRLIDADALMEVIREHDYPLRSHFNSTDNGMFTLGIQQAVYEAPTIEPVKWIPVSERLPEHEREAVLAYQRDFNEAHIAWISGGYWEDTSGTFAPGKITHWRPLPELPKGE